MDSALPIFIKYRSLADHPKVVWVCAIALILGGVLRVLFALAFGFIYSLLGYGGATVSGWFLDLSGFMLSASLLLLSVGMFGVLTTLSDSMDRLRKVANVGFVICMSGSAMLFIAVIYDMIAGPHTSYYYPSPLLDFLFLFGAFAGPFGSVMVGVAALWVRGLGVARYLVFPAALMVFPFVTELLFANFFASRFGYDSTIADIIYTVPQILSSLMWVCVGVFLFGVNGREARIVVREQQATEQKNFKIARRLYEEVWVTGNLKVLDELVSQDVVDGYHGEVGLANFRRNVSGLRRTFPDLDFVVEDQTTHADTVTTRWSLTGTDDGSGILWYPPTGQKVSISGSFTDRFESGKLVEHLGESDTRRSLKRLGLG